MDPRTSDEGSKGYNFWSDYRARSLVFSSFAFVVLVLVSGKLVEKVIDRFVYNDMGGSVGAKDLAAVDSSQGFTMYKS